MNRFVMLFVSDSRFAGHRRRFARPAFSVSYAVNCRGHAANFEKSNAPTISFLLQSLPTSRQDVKKFLSGGFAFRAG